MNTINSSDWNEIPKFLRKRSKKRLNWYIDLDIFVWMPLHAADLWCTASYHSRACEPIYDAQMLHSMPVIGRIFGSATTRSEFKNINK